MAGQREREREREKKRRTAYRNSAAMREKVTKEETRECTQKRRTGYARRDRRRRKGKMTRGASLRDDSVAQSADSQVSCKCTQNRCPTGSRGRARRDATPRSIDHARTHHAACAHRRCTRSRSQGRSLRHTMQHARRCKILCRVKLTVVARRRCEKDAFVIACR